MARRRPARAPSPSSSSSESEDGIDVNTVVDVKATIRKIHADRAEKRRAAEAGLNKKLDDLRTRARKRVAEHRKKIEDLHNGKIDRLLAAIGQRQALLRSIADKLAEIQEEGAVFAGQLEETYLHRRRKAASFGVAKRAGKAAKTAGR